MRQYFTNILCESTLLTLVCESTLLIDYYHRCSINREKFLIEGVAWSTMKNN